MPAMLSLCMGMRKTTWPPEKNGGQPQATVYLLQDEKTSYRGRAVLRIPWVSKSTINKTINAWGGVCYPIYQTGASADKSDSTRRPMR